MEDLFKKFINAGVGFVSLTNERVQTTIDALVKESKLSEQEGAKIMDELKKNGETKRKELEKQFQGLTSRLMKTVGVAPNSEVEELKRTVKGSGAKSGAAAGSKSSAAKPAAAGAASAASKAAGATKKAATSASSAAGTAQKSAAGKAGAAAKNDNGSKPAAKKPAAATDGAASNGGSPS